MSSAVIPIDTIGLETVEAKDVLGDPKKDDEGRHWIHVGDGVSIVTPAPELHGQSIAIVIPLDKDVSIRLETAARLYAFLANGKSPHWLSRQRRWRIARALRTDDARRSGALYRDIATAYFGARRVSEDPWKTSPLKAQIARLAAYGRRLVNRDYRQLLRGRSQL